jgi:Plasmid pRiA4b ORF-3-like protein
MARKTDIARLKITLDGVEPVVMRRICVPIGIRLDRLHDTMQAAMGWTNTHLWALRVRDVAWGPNDGDTVADGLLDATKATLLSVLEDGGARTLRYIYDLGDCWEHTIKLERIFDGVPGLDLPFLLDAKGRCPPEDIGGPSGYSEFLAVAADPGHLRHSEFAERFGTPFDPTVVNTKAIEAELQALIPRRRAPVRAVIRARTPAVGR